jgi:hypothetical protein
MIGNPPKPKEHEMTRKDRTTELAAINLAAGVEAEQIGTRNLTAALETLVDRHGVKAILLDLAFICHDKAEAFPHDKRQRLRWRLASMLCDRAQLKVEV